MKITKNDVIATASALADKDGLNSVSLKVVAEQLGIRTPSLYNHIESLEQLLLEVAHQGMKEMNEDMMQAAIGISGTPAIQAISIAYLSYMIAHPGVYETIQWATWHGTSETDEIFHTYLNLITTLIRSCGYHENDIPAIRDCITGMLHGFTTLQLRFALTEPEKVKKQLHCAIESLLTGTEHTYLNIS